MRPDDMPRNSQRDVQDDMVLGGVKDKKIEQLQAQLTATQADNDKLREVIGIMREALDSMLHEAQIIRVQQMQATTEAKWKDSLKVKATLAWKVLNEAHKSAIDLADSLDAPKEG